VAHACNPSYSEGRDEKDHSSKSAGQIVRVTLSQKYSTQKRAGGMAYMMEHLPRKHEALSSNPIATKNTIFFPFSRLGMVSMPIILALQDNLVRPCLKVKNFKRAGVYSVV
jgi:hypothetical protein